LSNPEDLVYKLTVYCTLVHIETLLVTGKAKLHGDHIHNSNCVSDKQTPSGYFIAA